MSHTFPHQLVEQGLESSTADGCVVLLDASTSANLRWANNTLTTNGLMHGSKVTVVSTVDGGQGMASAAVSSSASSLDDVRTLVQAADAAARSAGPADDAAELLGGVVDADFTEDAEPTSISVFSELAPALGEAFGRARGADQLLYGYVEHTVSTTYLATSSGLRRRHVQPTGHIGITGKSADLASSAWVGQSTRDFSDVDATCLDAELVRRLGWAQRTVALPAERYDTILPPTAVADLLIYAYWTAAARDAFEGRTVYSRPGGGTRVGEQLSRHPVQVWSDPGYAGLECAPFVTAAASSSQSSVFDNGLPLERTHWISDGRLSALGQTRRSAGLTDLAVTPFVDNLVMDVDGATGSVEDLVAGTERGLLLTCLWYIREVDPQTLLLTGLTRDGVYLVEDGEVTGAVNNFRFNESPVDLLDRFSGAGATVPSFSREWGDYFPRTATPALRIPDFNMSSVSQAQ
ncbi:MAG: metallopeptidase TldD-related protein [Actinomycetota bacterium]|nr:metallopeptidase TldD-related protein [Actinomycetota bacterium]